MEMKMKMKALCLMAALMSACVSETEYGKCIGAFDEPKPGLVYKLSVRNLVIGIIFIEMIVPPIVVVADEMRCPVGRSE
jgi:hypothetical protein